MRITLYIIYFLFCSRTSEPKQRSRKQTMLTTLK